MAIGLKFNVNFSISSFGLLEDRTNSQYRALLWPSRRGLPGILRLVGETKILVLSISENIMERTL